ncbi:MAG TPA: hypothetical protein VIE66_10170 [Methylocella sp.]|jgi:hypothetical protein
MTPEDKAKLIESDLKQADAKRRADAAEQEKLKMEKDEKTKADAEDIADKLDKLLSCMDSFASGMGSLTERMDAWEAMDSKKRKDGGEGEEIEEKGDPKELKADSRADSAAVLAELAEIQSHANRADSAWSKSAPAPWAGEMPDAYRRRLAAGHQKHCDAWRDVDLHDLKGTALKNATQAIFADSIQASMNPVAIGELGLREVKRRDPDSGHIVKEYYGDPMSWMQQFTGGRRVAKFNFNNHGR